MYCSICCEQAPHDFAYVSQESLSRAMIAAQEDIEQSRGDAKNHSVDTPERPHGRHTRIVRSPEYMKRLKRRQHRDYQVGCLSGYGTCFIS